MRGSSVWESALCESFPLSYERVDQQSVCNPGVTPETISSDSGIIKTDLPVSFNWL